MEVKFFTAAGVGLFSRNDMEDGHWVQQEMTVTMVFPFDREKVIERGMRLAFTNHVTGNLECFEIRRVTNQEPDHYQQVYAESVVIAELSDEHINNIEITNKNPTQALTTVLSGTLWSVGNVSVSNSSSCDISRGDVWQAVNQIAENWNVYITPRITLSGSGNISGRYLDVTNTNGTYRGLILSIDKNVTDSVVEYDDSEVVTALYGYGGNVNVATSGDDTTQELTFAGVTWSQTSSHPAKPAGQTYLEWTEKTAIYGRNGRPRFGYYQNGDITDANTLLNKTWQVLQKSCEPKINISGTVIDIKRLGYSDEPMCLHDLAIVEIRQTGERFYKQIVCLDVDLCDPTNTRPEIGDYIPNIIYINRQTNERASGRGGGGGRGQTNKEDTDSKYFTAWEKTDTKIGMVIGVKNGQDYIKNGEICLAINQDTDESGAYINANHVNISATNTAHMLAGELSYDANGRLVVKSAGGLYVQKTVSGVTAQFGVFDDNNLTAGVVISKANGETSLKLSANRVDVDGILTADRLKSKIADITDLTVGGVVRATQYYLGTGAVPVTVGSGVYDLKITLSGNTYTLQKQTYSNGQWVDIGSFSRATSLTGEWSGTTSSGRQYKVTASPQETILYSPRLDPDGWSKSGNPTWANDKKSFTQDILVSDVDGTGVVLLNDVYFSTTEAWNAGKNSVTTIQPTNLRTSTTQSGTSLGAISVPSGRYLTFYVGNTQYCVQII